jgi:hypothetical protein
LGRELTPPTTKKQFFTRQFTQPLTRPKHQKMDMRFGTWNIKSLNRAGSLKTAASKLGKCKLDFVGVQVRWENGGTEQAQYYTFFYEEGNVLSGVEFVTHRMLYIILRGHWCYILF